MQAVMIMFRSDGERRSFSISRDMTVIGRREDCDLRIPLSEISRKHCRLVRDGDMLRIEDLGSSNGTYCNGQRVQEAILSPGDTIQVGPVIFVLQIDGEPPDDQLHPVGSEELAAAVADEVDVTGNNEMGPLSPTDQSEAGDQQNTVDMDIAEAPMVTSDDSFAIVDDANSASQSGELRIDMEPEEES